jgi:hypothetical protein
MQLEAEAQTDRQIIFNKNRNKATDRGQKKETYPAELCDSNANIQF